MVPFGTTLQNFVNKSGLIIQPWIAYLQQFTIAPPPFMTIIPNGSPFSYEAEEPGFVYISVGTVSAINLIRGTDTILFAANTATPRFIPVGIKDIVTVTYSVLPTMKFIPSYGQNTTS